jgi:hypothetical protein
VTEPVAFAAGAEISPDGETSSVVSVRPDGRKWRVDLVYYGPPEALVEEAARVYRLPDCLGAFADPLSCAPLLDNLKLNMAMTLLEAKDVAAADYEFRLAARKKLIVAGEHPALEAAVIYAQGRTLANVFSFERRKAAVDMSPLRAASFAYWGLCQYSATAEPGAWWV